MAHPLVWPKGHFFYPIGNTPPTQFTANLPPEEPADILLLGCGDARSVLYTIFMDSKNCFHRKLDFTCNDYQSAILTRNLLLYTMLIDDIDGEAVKEIWNIYYHFFLDEASIQRLWKQCRKILDLTSNLDAWNEHEYGRCIRFCSDYTLQEIRRHCELYVQTESLSNEEKRALRSAFSSKMSKSWAEYNAGKRNVTAAWRSAGPLFLRNEDLLSSHFENFWKTGVTAGTQAENCIHVNPTFNSQGECRVHYATDPLASFHLIPALASVEDSHPPSPITTGVDLVLILQAQFWNWCSAFHQQAKASPPNLYIRFLSGDALAVCKALRCYASNEALRTGIYCRPWGGSTINLSVHDYQGLHSHAAPSTFNTIDTSNLSDHTGLLNILVATVPLLRRSPVSILRTYVLRRDLSSTSFNALYNLQVDIPAISVSLGLVPSQILSNVATESLASEPALAGGDALEITQLHDPISWRLAYNRTLSKVEPQQALECDPVQLGDALFALYAKLFKDENVASPLKVKLQAPIQLTRLVSYDRRSLVEFLRLAKARVMTDWPKAISHFLSRIEDDRTLLMGSNHYQALICNLFLQGIHTSPVLEMPLTGSESKCYAGWDVVPPIICMVIVVPRSKLRVLERRAPAEMSTQTFQCETVGHNNRNIYTSIRPIFGSIRRTDGSQSGIIITEDPLGWDGSSSLTVSFYLPAWTLTRLATRDPQSVQVVLSVREGTSSLSLAAHLGTGLRVYATRLDDTEHVFICKSRPDNAAEIDKAIARTVTATSNSTNGRVSITFSKDKLSSITIRAPVEDRSQRASLSNRLTAVTLVPQDWDDEVLLQFGDHRQHFYFPFPINMSALKTRIARQSGYLEVEAPIQVDPEIGLERVQKNNVFPIIDVHGIPQLLNIHYTFLDLLPALKHCPTNSMIWVTVDISHMFSEKEGRAIEDSSRTIPKSPLGELKATFVDICNHFFSGHGKPFALGLSKATCPAIGTFLFINRMRLDLSAHTVVADCCVLCSPDSLDERESVQRALTALFKDAKITNLSDEGLALWQHAIPAFVERCRTWRHKSDCSYRGRSIPLSDEFRRDPICECGRGVDLGSFTEVPAWKPLAPFVVRAAVGPIFTSDHDKIWIVNKSLSRLCEKCGSAGKPKLLVCSACKTAKYCSKSCQKQDWKSHKVECVAISFANLEES